MSSFVVPAPEEIVERILLILLGHKPAKRDELNQLLGTSTSIYISHTPDVN
jgi:hypothetical protein